MYSQQVSRIRLFYLFIFGLRIVSSSTFGNGILDTLSFPSVPIDTEWHSQLTESLEPGRHFISLQVLPFGHSVLQRTPPSPTPTTP